MASTLRWGIIGCGAIAKTFAFGLTQTDSGILVAAASRTLQDARKFADEHQAAHAYGDYASLLLDKEVDAVYISTPHPLHAEWAIKATNAGKHILCEKPLAVCHADGLKMVEAAQRAKVFLMEAFMYRCHPQTAKLVELIRQKTIGEVRFINASFGYGGGNQINLESRAFSHALAGGGILDVGCYPVSMSRLIAGAALGKDFADPVEVKGVGHIGWESRVDEWASAELKFENNIVAQVSTAVRVTLENKVTVFGSEGFITVPLPWTMDRAAPSQGRIIIHRSGKPQEEVAIPTRVTTFALEAELVANSIRAGAQSCAAMSWEDSLGNLKTLDAWRKEIGLVFGADQ